MQMYSLVINKVELTFSMRLQIEHRMDTVKEQMEHHLSAGADSMAHFYTPPSMLGVGMISFGQH